MELGLTTAVYIAAAVLFILSLGGVSGQESAKRAVWDGIFGMAFAIVATLDLADTDDIVGTVDVLDVDTADFVDISGDS